MAGCSPGVVAAVSASSISRPRVTAASRWAATTPMASPGLRTDASSSPSTATTGLSWSTPAARREPARDEGLRSGLVARRPADRVPRSQVQPLPGACGRRPCPPCREERDGWADLVTRRPAAALHRIHALNRREGSEPGPSARAGTRCSGTTPESHAGHRTVQQSPTRAPAPVRAGSETSGRWPRAEPTGGRSRTRFRPASAS